MNSTAAPSSAFERTGPEWTGFIGSYVRKRFGVGEKLYNVSLKNG